MNFLDILWNDSGSHGTWKVTDMHWDRIVLRGFWGRCTISLNEGFIISNREYRWLDLYYLVLYNTIWDYSTLLKEYFKLTFSQHACSIIFYFPDMCYPLQLKWNKKKIYQNFTMKPNLNYSLITWEMWYIALSRVNTECYFFMSC